MSAIVKKDELLKAVADVLDEAIATYEQLEKMDLDMQEVEDPSKAKKSEPAAAPAPAAEAKEEEEDEEEEEEEEDKKDMDKAHLHMKKEEEPKKEEEDEEEKEDEESDDKLMSTYKSLVSKMEKRGLIKAEPQAPIGNKSMNKSEASEEKEKGEDKIEALKKSFDERVDDLSKKIESIAKAVESISRSPAAPRRGLSGATPLRKSETENKPSVSKLQALDKLVELRKSGDQRVDTGLITRLEMGKLTNSDYERLNSILG